MRVTVVFELAKEIYHACLEKFTKEIVARGGVPQAEPQIWLFRDGDNLLVDELISDEIAPMSFYTKLGKVKLFESPLLTKSIVCIRFDNSRFIEPYLDFLGVQGGDVLDKLCNFSVSNQELLKKQKEVSIAFNRMLTSGESILPSSKRRDPGSRTGEDIRKEYLLSFLETQELFLFIHAMRQVRASNNFNKKAVRVRKSVWLRSPREEELAKIVAEYSTDVSRKWHKENGDQSVGNPLLLYDMKLCIENEKPFLLSKNDLHSIRAFLGGELPRQYQPHREIVLTSKMRSLEATRWALYYTDERSNGNDVSRAIVYFQSFGRAVIESPFLEYTGTFYSYERLHVAMHLKTKGDNQRDLRLVMYSGVVGNNTIMIGQWHNVEANYKSGAVVLAKLEPQTKIKAAEFLGTDSKPMDVSDDILYFLTSIQPQLILSPTEIDSIRSLSDFVKVHKSRKVKDI